MTARYLWLLDVGGPGDIRRYSTEAVTVGGAGGGDYRAGLADMTAGQGDEEIDVAVADPTLAAPESLAFAPCTLRRWCVGSSLSSAETYSHGRVYGLEYGPVSRCAVAWTIAKNNTPLPPCPDPDSQVDDETSPGADASYDPRIPGGQRGLRYPLVFGWPGYAPGLRDDSDSFPVVPVPVWQIPTTSEQKPLTVAQAVISEDPSTTNPSEVFLWDGQGEYGAVHDQTEVTSDNKDHRMTVVHFDTAGGDVPIYPLFDCPPYYAGYSPAGDAAPMRDAYSVITYMLRRFGGDSVDWALMPELEQALSPFMVDTYLNDDVGDVWAWVGDLLDCLPAEIRTSTRGKYLQHRRYTIDPRRTSRTVVAGQGAVRAGPVQIVGEPLNEFLAEFLDAAEGYVGRVLLSGSTDRSDAIVHGLCVRSQALYGRYQAPRIQIPWTWDHGTAVNVVTWRAERDALPHRLVRYTVPESWALREGMQVHLTDDDVGIDEPAIVDEPPLIGDASGAAVTFRIPGRL